MFNTFYWIFYLSIILFIVSANSLNKLANPVLVNKLIPQNEHHNIVHNEHHNTDHLPHVKEVNDAFLCGSEDICTKLKDFYISSNNSFDCHEDYLLIEFYIEDKDKKKVKSMGYYPPDGVNILKTQKKLDFCKKIKR